MITQYPSPQQLGTRHIADLFKGPVVIQEKVDGSQISFALVDGEVRIRSRGSAINVLSPNGMFAAAVAKIVSVKDKLLPGATYRGEYLAKPKHNALAYDRIPFGNIALFDVELADSGPVTMTQLKSIAEHLGMESVPVLFEGVTTADKLRPFLDNVSFLGGAKIEGVVVKNYALCGKTEEGYFAGKFVSEAFKEIHGAPTPNKDSIGPDLETGIISSFGTAARWAKAVQHLREAGQLTDTPKDIGLLVKEVQADIAKECVDEIKERLWQYHRPKLSAGFVNGLAQWYKERLLEDSLNATAEPPKAE